jgi:uncharacterized membrane protein YgcG
MLRLAEGDTIEGYRIGKMVNPTFDHVRYATAVSSGAARVVKVVTHPATTSEDKIKEVFTRNLRYSALPLDVIREANRNWTLVVTAPYSQWSMMDVVDQYSGTDGIPEEYIAQTAYRILPEECAGCIMTSNWRIFSLRMMEGC